MRYVIIVVVSMLIYTPTFGQKSISVSSPFIWSKVEVPNNWSPSTAINRKNEFNGTALAYGLNLKYSFTAKKTFLGRPIQFIMGTGYFKQQFNIRRPFDFSSPLEPVFYTGSYAYHCVETLVGATYNYPLNNNYFFSSGLTYSWLSSFKQEYTPVSNHGYGNSYQVKNTQLFYGNLLVLAGGINRKLGNDFSLGLHLQVPLLSRWRNDRIFKDEANTFYGPKFGLGTQLNLAYNL